MDKSFGWRKYLIGIVLIEIVLLIVNYKMSIGLLLGNILYFINDQIIARKFKNVKETRIITNIMFHMFLQLILVALIAYTSWNIGGLTCFISLIVGVSLPNIYYVFKSISLR